MKRLAIYFIAVIFTMSCSAITVIQTFNGMSFPSDWSAYIGAGSNGSSYLFQTGDLGGYLQTDLKLSQSNDGVAKIWKSIGSIYPVGTIAGNVQESWMQFDVKSLSGDSGKVTASVGMFNSAGDMDNTPEELYTLTTVGLLGDGTITKIYPRMGSGNSNGGGPACRVKMHIFNSASNYSLIAFEAYSIDSAGNVSPTAFYTGSGTFLDSDDILAVTLDSFGIKNVRSATSTTSSVFLFDNMYFSTESAFAGTMPTPFETGTVTYWVAPDAQGSGNGSSAANAADYTNASFWDMVQQSLQIDPVNVYLLNGTYPDRLTLSGRGNPIYKLNIEAVNQYGAVFTFSGNLQLLLLSSQNIELRGIHFTGNPQSWASACYSNSIKPARNIVYQNCKFENLEQVYYGAIGVLEGAMDVLIRQCTFNNVGSGVHAHMIYGSHYLQNVRVQECSFTDCKGDYVRFADDCDYGEVNECDFHSLSTATDYAFVSLPVFNDREGNPNDMYYYQYFGSYFKFTNNSFSYATSSGGERYDIQYVCQGYDSPDYVYALTSAGASLLADAAYSIDTRRDFLMNTTGIYLPGTMVYGNTYSGQEYKFIYRYIAAYGAPGRGWTDAANLFGLQDSTIGTELPCPPDLRNADFEMKGDHLRKWFYICPKPWRHPGLNGTGNAARLFKRISGDPDYDSDQILYQWVNNPQDKWSVEFLFAIGSNYEGTGIKFQTDIYHNDPQSQRFSVGVSDTGTVELYNGSSWTPLPTLGTVAFSTDYDGDGTYTNNANDVLNQYCMKIVGDYSDATPVVRVYLSEANSITLSKVADNLTTWVNGAPVVGSPAGTLVFNNFTSNVIIDEIVWRNNIATSSDVICEEVWNTGFGKISDLNKDCYVDLLDFAIFADDWLTCNHPDDIECE